MRSRTVLTLGLTATMAFAGSLAGADEGYRHGRLRYAEPGTTLQRATETEAEEAIQNLPFLPGDRIWTDAAGRAEFQFPDGTVVRLDRRGKLDYAGHEEDGGERIVLRLWSGSVVVHAPSRASLRFEVETPAGLVEALDRSVVRVDVDGGETRVSVYEGAAAFAGVRLSLGERTLARWGEAPGEPEGFDRFDADDFLEWDQDRESAVRWAADSARYLPDDLDEYSGELEGNGDWRYNGEVSGYVWVPHVEVGWQPYSNGRWAWTPYGWTWVPYENWGWAPFHYGRWGYGASLGWYWIPGRTWGPAWVSWAVGGGYAAWCPLGWRDRPVTPWGRWGAYGGGYGGRAVPRSGFGRGSGAWNVVRQGELGRGDLRGRRVDVARFDPAALRAADSPLMRPTRDVAVLRPADPAPRAISTRMTPGTFVRELSVDNKTTIPAPWTRGYGPPPAGVEGARYGVPRSTSSPPSDPQESRSPTGATPRGGSATASPATAEAGGVSASPRSAPRPAPWYSPSSASGGSDGAARQPAAGSGSSDRRQRQNTYRYGGAAPRDDSGQAAAPRGGAYPPGGSGSAAEGSGRSSRPVFGSGYRQQGEGGGARPRTESGSSGSGYRAPDSGASRPQSGARPRSESGGTSSGYRPQGESGGSRSGGGNRSTSGFGGSAPRPAPTGGQGRSSGGGQARSAGGGSRGGDHAAPRSRPNRD